MKIGKRRATERERERRVSSRKKEEGVSSECVDEGGGGEVLGHIPSLIFFFLFIHTSSPPPFVHLY